MKPQREEPAVPRRDVLRTRIWAQELGDRREEHGGKRTRGRESGREGSSPASRGVRAASGRAG